MPFKCECNTNEETNISILGCFHRWKCECERESECGNWIDDDNNCCICLWCSFTNREQNIRPLFAFASTHHMPNTTCKGAIYTGRRSLGDHWVIKNRPDLSDLSKATKKLFLSEILVRSLISQWTIIERSLRDLPDRWALFVRSLMIAQPSLNDRYPCVKGV